MTVRVIVTTLNYLPFTKTCVRSILENTKTPYELVFVDDGSTDGTVEWLKGIPNAKVLENRRKQHGPWAGYNMAIDLGGADYYAFVDRDMVVTPNWLRKLTSLLTERPEVGIVSPVLNVGPGEQSLPQGGPPNSHNVVQAFLGVNHGVFLSDVHFTYEDIQRLGRMVEERFPRQFIYNAPLWFHCVVMPHRTIEEIGKLDESFFWCDGDCDYSYRSLQAGLLLAVRRDTYAHHLWEAEGISVGAREASHYKAHNTSTGDWQRKYGTEGPFNLPDGKAWNDLLPNKDSLLLTE